MDEATEVEATVVVATPAGAELAAEAMEEEEEVEVMAATAVGVVVTELRRHTAATEVATEATADTQHTAATVVMAVAEVVVDMVATLDTVATWAATVAMVHLLVQKAGHATELLAVAKVVLEEKKEDTQTTAAGPALRLLAMATAATAATARVAIPRLAVDRSDTVHTKRHGLPTCIYSHTADDFISVVASRWLANS